MRETHIRALTSELNIAAGESFILYLGSANPEFPYVINNFPILPVLSYVRDLGYNLAPDLKHGIHCKLLFSRAMARAFMLFRRLRSNDVSILLKTYTTYIRPLLESNTAVFNPYLKRDIKLLERVQNYCTRKIIYRCFPDFRYPATMPDSTYRNRLLGLQSLALRRKLYGLTLCFKIMNNMTAIDPHHG